MAEMAMSGSKGVGIRLFVEGGELVRKTFDQIKASGEKMWAEIAAGEKSANPVLRGVSGIVGGLQEGMAGLASRAGSAGTQLAALGVAGLALGAALGGLSIAAMKAREAMQWADDLQAQANALGVSAEALQAYRYAAAETDVTNAALEGGLQSLNAALGAMQSGIADKKVAEAFAALKIDRGDLATMRDASELLPLLATRLSEVGSHAEQVQLARRLGIEALLPLLREGGEGVANLTNEARELGLVMEDDVVHGLAEANREMERSKEIIDAKLRVAVAGLADDWAMMAGAAADSLGAVIGWLDATGRAINRLLANRSMNGTVWDLGTVFARARNQVDAASRDAASRDRAADLMAEIRSRIATRPDFSSGGGGGGGSRRRSGGSRAAPRLGTTERYSPYDIIEQDDIDRMRLAIELETARAQKNEELIRQLEREVELRRLIADYTAMGYSAEDARLNAQLEQSRREVGRQFSMEFNDSKLDEATELWRDDQAFREQRVEEIRGWWRDGVKAALSGDTEDFLSKVLSNAWNKGVESIADRLFDIVLNAWMAAKAAGGGAPYDTGGGWWSTALSFLGFGGRRAGGGGMGANYRYDVAEDGRAELGVFGPGYMLNHDQAVTALRDMVGAGAGQGAGRPSGPAKVEATVNVNVNGAKTDREIRGMVADGVREGMGRTLELAREQMPGWGAEFQLLKG